MLRSTSQWRTHKDKLAATNVAPADPTQSMKNDAAFIRPATLLSADLPPLVDHGNKSWSGRQTRVCSTLVRCLHFPHMSSPRRHLSQITSSNHFLGRTPAVHPTRAKREANKSCSRTEYGKITDASLYATLCSERGRVISRS